MNIFKKFDEKYGDSGTWQFIKFNIVSNTVFLLQLLLANVLPLIFDSFKVALPEFLRVIFTTDSVDKKYIVDGAVTWGYVLPLFLSNFLANIYGYFVNMKATFKGKGGKYSLLIYVVVVFVLILFSTWLQGVIINYLMNTGLSKFARTIASALVGFIQFLVIFPLEKYVLFRKDENE